ncbi:transposase [Aquimarina sp. RZ0]|uniref:transposase n=1 Tax=Aquimarina sp. RZ0 TaxID=2607730 RepID=UPI0011F21A01|nr:transposase [Aquimarina sp. RZ0]KAA1244684.1 transposase [Aquimarina sp. RZ0]
MKKSRRKFSSAFKAKVALEAIKDQLTLQEIASKFDIHPSQISTWKREFIDNSSKTFDSKTKTDGYFGVTVPPISVKWCHFERYCNYS